MSRSDIPRLCEGDNAEYTENIAIFPGGPEWRWFRPAEPSFAERFRSIAGRYTKTSTELFLKTDIDRTGQRYVYFRL